MKNSTIDNGFLFLLGTVVLGQLLLAFTSLNLQPILIVLTVLTLVSGGMIIFLNSDELIGRFEKIKEHDEAQKSKASNWYLVALAFIIVVGVVFRLVNINSIGIHYDEYTSLINAMGTQDHGTANYFLNGKFTPDNPRFSYTIWAMGWLFSVFGRSLLVARLPGILLSSLTAIPLYFLGSRMNRVAGLSAAVIWLMSPWAIVMGRFFREYAYFPFYYVLVFILLLWFSEYLIAVIKKEKKARITPLILGSIALVAPLIYSLVLAENTTFKLVIIPCIIGIFYFCYLILSGRKKQWLPSKRHLFLGVLGFILLIAGLAKLITVITFAVNLLPHYDPGWVRLAFENGPRNWFYPAGFFTYCLLIGLGILGSLALLMRKKFPSVFFVTLIFLGYIYAFMFHFNFIYEVRYTFPIHLWSIPLLAAGIQFFYWILLRNKERTMGMITRILFVLTLILTLNPLNTYHAINMVQSGRDLITWEYLFKFDKLAGKYGPELKNSAILCWECSSVYWFGLADLTENNVREFTLSSPEAVSSTVNFMDRNKHGWVVLNGEDYKKHVEVEYKKNKWSKKLPTEPPTEDIHFEGLILEYVDNAGGYYLYRW